MATTRKAPKRSEKKGRPTRRGPGGRAAAPKAGRPHMPGYGVSKSLKGALSWTWAEKRMAACRNFWVVTTRPDGRPHAMPVWGLWFEGAFVFSTSATSRKARNLAKRPQCVIATESADEAVIIEGAASAMTDRAALRRYAAAYKKKYDWEIDPDGDGYFAVKPRVAFGFIEQADKFATASTKWTF